MSPRVQALPRARLVVLLLALALAAPPGCNDKAGDSKAPAEAGAAPAQTGDRRTPPAGGQDVADTGSGAQASRDDGGMSAAVREYYAAMERGDLDGMLAVCTEEMAEHVENRLAEELGSYDHEKLTKLVKEAAKKVNYTILKEKPNLADEDHGTVIVQRVYEEGEDEITFWMAKKDGKWRLVRADSERRGHGMGDN